MPEWWSYTLSDFLLFSPRTYYRLIASHNAALWPSHLLAVGLGVAAGAGAWATRPSPGRRRAICALLAIVWAWVAWSFVWRRYTTINWAASYLISLWAVEVVLLLWLGVVRREITFGRRPGALGHLGTALLAIGLLGYPVVAPFLGRGWAQAEAFGIAPDPTALVTIGLLLQGTGPTRWALLVPPLLWCVVAAATLYAMGSPEAWAPAAAAVLALAGLRDRPMAAT